MTTSTTTGAKLTWAQTALGGNFRATWIERLHADDGTGKPAGWLPVAKLLQESYITWTDVEARRNVAESYRMWTEDIYGNPSQYTATVSVTVPGTMMAIVSNQNPSINQDLWARWPVPVDVAEDLVRVPASGRYGQRQYRNATPSGESLDVTSFLRRINQAAGVRGPAMWRNLLTKLRSDLPYVCLLDQFGDRWFVGDKTDRVTWQCNAEAEVPLDMAELTDTPAVVVIS